MKLTREIVQRALAQHDKLVALGVDNTARFDVYDHKGKSGGSLRTKGDDFLL